MSKMRKYFFLKLSTVEIILINLTSKGMDQLILNFK